MALDGYVQTKWFSPRLMVILGMMIVSSPIVGILMGIAFGSTHSGHIPWIFHGIHMMYVVRIRVKQFELVKKAFGSSLSGNMKAVCLVEPLDVPKDFSYFQRSNTWFPGNCAQHSTFVGLAKWCEMRNFTGWQSEFPSRRTASSATPIGVSGHRFSLQNKCELGDSLSVTSFAHLGGKWAGVHNESFSIRKQWAFSQVRRCPSSALYSLAIRSSSRSLKLLKLSGDFKVYESSSLPFRSFQPISPPISTI